MELKDLLTDDAESDARFAALEITGVSADSRSIGRGALFVAVPGTKSDGLSFVPQAIAAGAAAIMAEREPPALPDGVALVRTRDARRALALAAAKFYPRQPPTIAAITGTSGKTSVAAFTRQIWTALGHAAASIGTVGVVSPNGEIYSSLTTPDPVELHRTLDRLAGEGVSHLALEASSHGLDQHRLDGVRVGAAAFTNLSRDHLDYHTTMEAYLDAKLILFERLLGDKGAAVIEVDHDYSDVVVASVLKRKLELLTVGRGGSGIRIVETTIEGFAQKITVEHGHKMHTLRLPLVGEFQVENALLAAGLAIVTGGDAAKVFAALETLKGARGRLELAGNKNGAPVFIDYAHKPDALAKALEALRPYVTGKLVVVFGAGGDRDRGKRSQMGAIAAAKADRVIVTDDNPRSEEPAAIRRAILAAAPGAGEIGDRRRAIAQAIGSLRRGDVLLVAGKGHETGQIVGQSVLPFSDHEAVASALKEFA